MNGIRDSIKDQQEVIDSGYITLLKSWRFNMNVVKDVWCKLLHDTQQSTIHILKALKAILLLVVFLIITLLIPLWILFVPFLKRYNAKYEITRLKAIEDQYKRKYNIK